MDGRQAALRAWAEDTVGAEFQWAPVTGDASSRRYFRLRFADRSLICADAPPQTEKNAAFLSVREQLAGGGLPVPELIAADLDRGFLLLEDFGDRHLQDWLEAEGPDEDYRGALSLLHKIQAVAPEGLPSYDRALLGEEYSRFYEWFCLAFIGLEDEVAGRQIVSAQGELLVEAGLAQPEVFVFRDYHCRNLLVRGGQPLGMIDFQDAVAGPLCYDLVSLLKDCYIRWPADRVRGWAVTFRDQRLQNGLDAGESEAEFLRWFDWIGLHRHLKVLGNFTRLAIRDNKPRYLADIPMVLAYVEEVLPRYAEFAPFAQWWREYLAPHLVTRGWGGGP